MREIQLGGQGEGGGQPKLIPTICTTAEILLMMSLNAKILLRHHMTEEVHFEIHKIDMHI